MKNIFLLLYIIFSYTLVAQVSDDFEDGNFTENPEWVGNQQLFIVNISKQLQLHDSIENMAYLSTQNAMMIDTEWRSWIKLSFSPSANNFARFYLVSDNFDLSQPLNGYFLQFGESGSSDAIELFRQEGDNFFSVCRSTDGLISSSFEIRVKVTRDAAGLWKLFVDKNGGEDFGFEAEGIDNTIQQTSHIGYFCKYTKSNSSKMYFDEVYAGPFIIDNEPPVITAVTATTDSTLSIQFNEILNEGSAANISNYYVNNGIGNPASAHRDNENPSIVNLVFFDKFQSGVEYTIDVSGVKDLAENLMLPTQKMFSFYKPQLTDIVINEIMADPNPPVLLPEYEYLELFNQTQYSVDLEGWKLIIGTSEKEFSSVIIDPGEYLILAKQSAHDAFVEYGNFYGFSSFSLTNSGQSLLLISKDGTTISEITYTSDWYHDPEKENGGWSIEQKNPRNVCSGSENWSASKDVKGGTPGGVNSVADNIVLLPKISSVRVITDNIIELLFNQSMNDESISVADYYSVNAGIGIPKYVYTYYDDPAKVELYFNSSFNKGLEYELAVKSSVQNCIGLNMDSDTVIKFGLPEAANTYDIVINEILFNPLTNGEDYVELYNRSNKIIDVATLQIASVKTNPPNPPDTSMYNISSDQKLFLPGEYLLVTSSPSAVKNQYYTANSNAFLKVDPFPSFNNDKGHVFIKSLQNMLVDSFSYNESMQYPLLTYVDGVSLERINPDVNLSTTNNWHSASEAVGFGTPGYLNSQYVGNEALENNIIVDPEIFSPDNDGYDDIVNIKYEFDTPGYVMSIIIYNAEGYKIRQLINNEYLGTTGSVSWDGLQDNNTKAPIGIYIFYITVYDIEGNVKKYKKTCVLASYL